MRHLLLAREREPLGQRVEHARQLEPPQDGFEIRTDDIGRHCESSPSEGGRGPERQGVLRRGAEIAGERDDASGRRGRRRGDALFEHALQPVDVEHVGGEGDGARLGDARRRRSDARGRAAHRRAACASTARGCRAARRRSGRSRRRRPSAWRAERVDIAHRVDAALDRDNRSRRSTGRRAAAADAF